MTKNKLAKKVLTAVAALALALSVLFGGTSAFEAQASTAPGSNMIVADGGGSPPPCSC